MNDAITILLVDDHGLVRSGVRAYLESFEDLCVVGEADCGEEAVRLAADLAPDVVLMDLLMPGMGGVQATAKVREVSPRTQVVVLTSFHDDAHIFPAVKAGALSYLLKDIAPAHLADAVRSAARGEAVMNPGVAARLLGELNAAPIANLTGRELQVLHLIADGLTNAQIAAGLVISEKTVKSHVGNILSKLHLADRTQAAILAWKEGIKR